MLSARIEPFHRIDPFWCRWHKPQFCGTAGAFKVGTVAQSVHSRSLQAAASTLGLGPLASFTVPSTPPCFEPNLAPGLGSSTNSRGFGFGSAVWSAHKFTPLSCPELKAGRRRQSKRATEFGGGCLGCAIYLLPFPVPSLSRHPAEGGLRGQPAFAHPR